MKKQIICIFVCTLLITTTLTITGEIVNDDSLNGGWIEERDGITILHVSGSNYEMGYQHGHLLKDEIQANIRMMIGYLEQAGFTYEVLVEYWDVLKEYVPERFMTELEGVSDGSGIALEEIGVFNIVHDVVNLIHCCGAILWNDATADGELIHVRSADLRMNIYDNVSDTHLQENQVLLVHNPTDGYASMSPIWSGGVGSYGGINEKGIAIGETTCWTNDTTLEGACASFRMGLVLDTADSASDALQIMNTHRTCGWSLLISDAHEPVGYVLEQTATLSYVCTWADTQESNDPFWKIDHVLRRGNCYVSTKCANTQRSRYDPSGIHGFIDLITGKNAYFIIWNHYKALSKGIEKEWGTFDLNTTMGMLHEVYTGKTDIMYHLISLFIFPPQPLHQWVACPKTGDMLLSFADETKIASENPVQYFNLFELIESEPP